MPRKETTTTRESQRVRKLTDENRHLKRLLTLAGQQLRALAARKPQGQLRLRRFGPPTSNGAGTGPIRLRVWGKGAGRPGTLDTAQLPPEFRQKVRRRIA
jgi:hypothetical protein